jgi:hypothetical protein
LETRTPIVVDSPLQLDAGVHNCIGRRTDESNTKHANGRCHTNRHRGTATQGTDAGSPERPDIRSLLVDAHPSPT